MARSKLDKKKQPFIQPPPEQPRVSKTSVDPLDLLVTIVEADERRERFIRLLRDTATSLVAEAERIDRDKLDSDGNGMHRVSYNSIGDLIAGFQDLDSTRGVIRNMLGFSIFSQKKLEQHPQILATLEANHGSPYCKREPPTDPFAYIDAVKSPSSEG